MGSAESTVETREGRVVAEVRRVVRIGHDERSQDRGNPEGWLPILPASKLAGKCPNVLLIVIEIRDD